MVSADDETRRDYGGLIQRIPSRVETPHSLEALAALVRQLRADGTPWLARGAGHSAGGQPLINGGVVIATRALAGIVEDDGETITVRGGTRWLDVVEHLAIDGRRPVVVTDQLSTTVAGTLSVGGIGDTSQRDGLQIDHVRALTLVTPDGEIHRVQPGDELFEFALAGHGQIGVIADATLAVAYRVPALAVRAYMFPSLAVYLAAVAELADTPFAFIRGRMYWRREHDDNPIQATIGAFSTDLVAAPPAALAGSTASSDPQLVDLVAHARTDTADWPAFAPCAELVLPLAKAVAVWAALDRELRPTGLPSLFRDGCSVSVVAPAASPRPLSPLSPDGAPAVVIALRTRLDDEVLARKTAAILRGVAVRALTAGGNLYAIGEEPDDARWLRAQYASVWPTWTALKTRLDHARRCHPWLV